MMTKTIIHQALDHGKKVYHPNTIRYSAVTERVTESQRAARLESMGVAQHFEPPNQTTISRIFRKVHTLQSHSPLPVRLKHLQMWLRWQRKMSRRGVSAKYANTYSLEKWL